MSTVDVDLNIVNMLSRRRGSEEEQGLLDNEERSGNESGVGSKPEPAVDDQVDVTEPASDGNAGNRPVPRWRLFVSIIILTFINLINYMDRYSIAGVLNDLQNYYGINDTLAGLISTTFIISYMLLSPLFGYLGDRYNRKRIMSVGIFVWSSVTLASSFIPSNLFPVFLFLRMLVGIGEASYSTIAPTIIADMFVGTERTAAFSVFYFAIPVGSGLGYIAGSSVAHAAGSWEWALRVTPVFGITFSILILILVHEPKRGEAEHSTNLHATSWSTDIKYLLTHKSFMLSSLGVTCVAFVSGALAFWAPKYITKSVLVSELFRSEKDLEASVSMTFGTITCAAGFLGVMLGSFCASKLRPYTRKADPFVCAFGLLTSAPFLFFAILLSRYNIYVTWVLIFVGETLLCLNWTIVADILMYLVIPTRRSSAEAVQILLSHLLGDAGSPFLVGAISDQVQNQFSSKEPIVQYLGLEYALYMTTFVCVLGGGFFLFCAIFIEEDRAETERIEREAKAEEERRNFNQILNGDDSNAVSIPNGVSDCV